MSWHVAINGAGAVSAAGWGLDSLVRAVEDKVDLGVDVIQREGCARAFRVRKVPKPPGKLPFARHPRMRRTSSITKYAMAAALEAIGDERLERVRAGKLRVGVILTLMNGCVNFSSRFYREVLKDPGTASPIVFPETVFNAPASHLAAYLGSREMNYTMVGDSAQFLPALDLAARWLCAGLVDGCVVVGAEEADWLSTEGFGLFMHDATTGEGAGALYLESSDSAPCVELVQVTDAVSFFRSNEKEAAARRVADAITVRLRDSDLVCGSAWARQEVLASFPGTFRDLTPALGHTLGASSALQCAFAAGLLEKCSASRKALLFADGHNQQCCAAVMARNPEPSDND